MTPNGESKWRDRLNESLPEDFERAREKVSKVEAKAKQKEARIQGAPTSMKALEESEMVGDMYISCIKAKLAVLENSSQS